MDIALRNALIIAMCAMATQEAAAFVLNGGIKGARQPVTADNPTVKFLWSGDTPVLSDKGTYGGAAFDALSDHDAMKQLIVDAMNIWSQVPGSFIKLTMAESSAATQDAHDN